MKQNKFNVITWVASAGGASAAAWISATVLGNPTTGMGWILWMGLFFMASFVGGFAGMALSLVFSRKYAVTPPRNWAVSMAIAAVVLFGIGAVGQTLFMITRTEKSVTKPVDMVLLLDGSSSMVSCGYTTPRTEAGCQFVDSLQSSDQLAAISFSATILGRTALVPMDQSGKGVVQDFIRTIDSAGLTDFDQPLENAMNILNEQGRPDSSKAVILLTDGDAPISYPVRDTYLSSDVKLFSIRISSTDILIGNAKDLADFAAATNGFDILLTPAADGSVSTDDLVQAFQNAFEATTQGGTDMILEPLIGATDVTLWQFIVRTITLICCSVVFGMGYFARIEKNTLILNLIAGLVASVLITILCQLGTGMGTWLYFPLIAAAYVSMNLDTGDDIYV